MTLLVFGGVVLSAIAIVFGRMGVWAAAAAFLACLAAIPLLIVSFFIVAAIHDANTAPVRHSWGTEYPQVIP